MHWSGSESRKTRFCLNHQSFPQHLAEVECNNLSLFALPVFAPTRFAKPPDSQKRRISVCKPDCVGAQTVMNYKTSCEARRADANEQQIFFTLDLAGNFKFVDSATERMFGFNADEMCRM